MFPDDEPLATPCDRAEPTVWVRRLVVAGDATPDPPVVREVEFRAGLNIVRVADRPEGETRPIGHSVGKTLLTRLVRYCLGEARFADADTTAAVGLKRPGAYVLAEVRVAGASWVVARPLRAGPPSDSWAVRADAWQAVLAADADRLPYTEFVAAVTEAVVAPPPAFTLPHAGRAPRWLDLLAWLARDSECHYRHHNEWRDPEADSGTARLHLDDAGLLISWGMGLLDSAEIEEQRARAALRAEKSKAEAEVARLDGRMAVLRPLLGEALGLDGDALAAGLFGTAAEDELASRQTSLTALLKDFDDNPASEKLRVEAVRTAATVEAAEQELRRLEGIRETTRDELRQLEEAGRPPPLDPFDPRRGCPLETACPLHESNVTPIPDAARTALVAAKRRQLAAVGEQIDERTRALTDLEREADAADTRYKADQKIRQTQSRGTLAALARVDVQKEQLGEFAKAQQDRETEQAKADRLEGKIAASLAKQQEAKRTHAARRGQVSRCFDRAIKALLGPEAGGRVALDARGMRPEPDAGVPVRGGAFRALGTVLAFDLGCLAAAVEGVGRLPAFWMHDSPHEGDVEPLLYERLFRFARDLELTYGEREPAFQYIVTTRTTPPAELAVPPFARLSLDARDEAKLLLGVRL